MPKRRHRGWVATASAVKVGTVAVVVAGLAGIGWLVFRAHGHRPPQLAAATRRLIGAQVTVKAPGGGFTATTAELGLVVDAPASTRYLRYKADERAVFALVAARDRTRTAPVEPTVKPKRDGTGFIVIAGQSGHGIDPRELLRALTRARTKGPGRLEVTVGRGSVPPRVSLAEAEALAGRAGTITQRALTVTAGGATAQVQPATMRAWIHSEPGPDGIHLTIDPKLAHDGLGRVLAKATVPAAEARFSLGAAGQPQIKAGTPGQACCADPAPGLVLQALFDRPRGTTGPAVTLPLAPIPPKIAADAIPALGIKELVSTFTTRYVAGQPRVTNIHRIADIVKGTLILPGQLFSLNGAVGERTPAKGFVVDHEINQEGNFDDAVGGGISQFATTTFNAAFFGGLDYGEYQSHTIYISRYPFGREATVSWQHPDLQIKNTTPYAVAIWASYTDTSLTVSLYSTKYLASVVQSGQTTSPFGPNCTKVVTDRTRTYLDGRTSLDHVYALYQPAEGVKCR